MTTYNTGNPIGSTDPKDLYDNAQNLDVLVNSATDVSHADRKGVQRKTWRGMEAQFDQAQSDRADEFAQFMADSAYQELGDYGAGIVITRYNQVFRKDGEWYRPVASLELPYTTTGIWVDEAGDFVGAGDAVLRQDLAATGGSALVGFQQSGTGAVAATVQSKLREFVSSTDYNSDANFNAAKAGKVSVDAANRLRSSAFIAGTEELSGPATRDSFVVGRNLDGATDCHAFADRTIINNVTDAGTYGAFDATTELYGSHTQNHVYAFQDRVRYRGSGNLQNSIGFYSSALHSGAGTVDSRIGMMIDEMAKTGVGTIASQIGILINPLTTGANNVGINIGQTVGWTLYAGGGAKGYHGGQFGIGTEPVAGAKLHVNADSFGNLPVAVKIEQPNAWSFYCTGSGKLYHQAAAGFGVEPVFGAVDFASTGGVVGFLATDASSATFGAAGDRTLKFVTGGDIRLLLDATTYTFKPYGDNTQKLGNASFRWSTVYAGTGAINTSDAREKQDIAALDDAEKRVAAALKGLIKKFRFKDAVQAKGDGARIHVGVVAQEVVNAFQAESLDPVRYGILCYDEWTAELDEEGNEIRPAGNRYGVRYEELLAFIISAL